VTSRASPCVLSVSEHAGWAYVLCVTTSGEVPSVVERRRVTLIEAGVPTQPYHHEATAMSDDRANALIARVRQSIESQSTAALRRIVSELAPAHAVVGLAIRQSPFADLPEDYADVRTSYRLLCSADGMLYQRALCRAAREHGLDVWECRRGGEMAVAAQALGVTPAAIEEFVSRTGRPAGPPWTEEHRRAYAMGIAVIADHVGSVRL